MNPVGKPDAGNRHVRFDERGWETGRRSAPAPAPNLDSTGFSCRARPEIIFRGGHESGFHGIILNVRLDAVRFPIVVHRVVVGFRLPEWLARAPEQPIRLTCRVALLGFVRIGWDLRAAAPAGAHGSR